MTAFFRATTRFLDRPLSGVSRGLVLLGIVALVTGALLPLWRIQLVAPQYQEGLTLEMYTHKIAAGNGGQDLAEINTLNHYIGMKPIAQADFAEMTWMPFAIGVFALLGAAGGGDGAHREPRRSRRAVRLLRRVLDGHVRLSPVELRPPSRSARADARRAVHAGGHRQPADRQLRPDQPADGRHRAAWACSSPPSPRAIWWSRKEEL